MKGNRVCSDTYSMFISSVFECLIQTHELYPFPSSHCVLKMGTCASSENPPCLWVQGVLHAARESGSITQHPARMDLVTPHPCRMDYGQAACLLSQF